MSGATTTATEVHARRRRRISKTLSRFISGEILKIFLLVLAIQVIIFGAVFTINASQEFGFDPSLLFRVFRITFAYSLYYTIPISILIATGLSFGRMIADREIAAFRSFGISHLEMLFPAALLGAVLTAGSFFINGWVIPEVRFATDNLGRLIVDQLRSMDDGYDKSFYLDPDTKTNRIVIEELRRGVLRNIFLFAEEPARIFEGVPGLDADEPDERERDGQDRGGGGDEDGGEGGDARGDARGDGVVGPDAARSFPVILHADAGELLKDEKGGDVLELRRVDIFYDQDFRPSSEARVETMKDFLQVARFAVLRMPISGFGEKKRVRKAMPNPMLLDFARDKLDEHESLSRMEKRTEAQDKELRRSLNLSKKARATYHRRLTYAATAVIFPIAAALIALALNSTNRLLPFFVGTATCCLVFFPLEVQGQEFAWRLDQMWLAHLGNIALVIIAAVLFFRLERVSRARKAKPRAAADGGAR